MAVPTVTDYEIHNLNDEVNRAAISAVRSTIARRSRHSPTFRPPLVFPLSRGHHRSELLSHFPFTMSRYPPVEFENPQNLRGIWFDSPTTRKSVPVSAGSDYEANYDCDPFVADLPYDIDAPEYYWQQWTSTCSYK